MDDVERDAIELAALMARAPRPGQAPRSDVDAVDLERKLTADRLKRDRLADDVEWDRGD